MCTADVYMSAFSDRSTEKALMYTFDVHIREGADVHTDADVHTGADDNMMYTSEKARNRR